MKGKLARFAAGHGDNVDVIVAVAIVVVVLLYISLLVVKKIGSNSELAGLEKRIESGTQEYRQVLDNQQNLVEGRQKLVSLHQLSTNRFLICNASSMLPMRKRLVDN